MFLSVILHVLVIVGILVILLNSSYALNSYVNLIYLKSEPNMATMLSYILTDLDVPKSVLEKCLKKVVKGSFNTISVDGDQSTSDTVLVMSSQIIEYKASDEIEFEKALQEVCNGLAEDIVRNGKK